MIESRDPHRRLHRSGALAHPKTNTVLPPGRHADLAFDPASFIVSARAAHARGPRPRSPTGPRRHVAEDPSELVARARYVVTDTVARDPA